MCHSVFGVCTEYVRLTTVLHHLDITPSGSVLAMASLTRSCCTAFLNTFASFGNHNLGTAAELTQVFGLTLHHLCRYTRYEQID